MTDSHGNQAPPGPPPFNAPPYQPPYQAYGGHPPRQPYGGPPPGWPPPGPPPRRGGRGWLIALIVVAVLAVGGTAVYYSRLLDPMLKKIGLFHIGPFDQDEAGNQVYSWRGYQDANAIIGGKRWAERGRCATNWVEFRSDGSASSSDGTGGTWELERNQDFTIREDGTGKVLQFEARATYDAGDDFTFVLHGKNVPPNTRGTYMEHCGPASG